MQHFQICACEAMVFKSTLQAMLTGEGLLEALLEILDISLPSAQCKEILISHLLNQAVLSGSFLDY